MRTISVEYVEERWDTQSGLVSTITLGHEHFEDIDETLLPNFSKYDHLYMSKKFSSHLGHRWKVENVLSAPNAAGHLDITVTLKQQGGAGEEYLSETIDRTRNSLARLIYPGTIVEVDYGFIPITIKKDGSSQSNLRYPEVLFDGEMHKRRLAIVVQGGKSGRRALQVLPVTSQQPSSSDKYCFQISDDTLSRLSHWGKSGAQSWVIGNMIDTVSINRVLPPESVPTRGGVPHRDIAYRIRLSGDEKSRMIEVIQSFAGADGHQNLRHENGNLFKENQKTAQELSDAKTELERLRKELERLKVVEKIASDLAYTLEYDLESEVKSQMIRSAEAIPAGQA